MLNRIKQYFSNNKIMAIFPILALAMLAPALMLAVTTSQENRSKAAPVNCTVASPCIGEIQKTISNNKNKTPVYLFEGRTLMSIKPVNFETYLKKQVSIVGNMVDSKTEKLLYVTSIKIYEKPVKTAEPKNCMLVSQNCGYGPCGNQSLGELTCNTGFRCLVNNCYPENRTCAADFGCSPKTTTLPRPTNEVKPTPSTPVTGSYKCLTANGVPSCLYEQNPGGYPTYESCLGNCRNIEPPLSSSTPVTCTFLWWFDSTNKNCQQKQFCGSYMYQGLQTFRSQEDCQKSLPPPAF